MSMKAMLGLWLAIVGFGATLLAADPSPADQAGVVYLDGSLDWVIKDGKRSDRRLLVRELVRQAFLLAARDELGLLTRDYWLGEPMPGPEGPAALDLVVGNGRPVRVELWKGTGKDRSKIGQGRLELRGNILWHPRLATEMESFSRTKCVEVLKMAGFQGRPHPWKPDLPLPDEVKPLLDEMTFSSQYLAVRRIHAAIRKDGESPERLGGLVRGYANLGVLTEFHWHPAHKVFKARAMLYAERLLKHTERPAWSKWHRAYVYALVGLHQRALTEIEALESDASSADERPSWALLLAPYCRYQIDQFDEKKVAPADQQFFQLLTYLNAEQSASSYLAISTGLKVLEKIPECYRVHAGVCGFAGVGVGHRVTIEWILLLGGKLYPRLKNEPDLPPAVQKMVRQQVGGVWDRLLGGKKERRSTDEFQVRRRLTTALLEAGRVPPAAPPKASAEGDPAPADGGDRAEFSWSVLGHLLGELSFVQVGRRVRFEAGMLCVSPDEFLATASPLYADHPYRAVIESFSTDVSARIKAFEQMKQLQPHSLEVTARPFWDQIRSVDRERMIQWYRESQAHADPLVNDLRPCIRCTSDPQGRARQLLQVSPENPQARAVLLEKEWNNYGEKFGPEWEKKGQPAVLLALGTKYDELKRYDDAQRCIAAAIRQVPECDAYFLLSQIYKKQGNDAKFVSTLEEFLTKPSFGLEHASIEKELAKHFAARGQWDKALPHAERCAQSYSGWGLSCAGGCHEALHHWAAAEKLFHAVTERYDTSWLTWYQFCQRTGQGDLAAARRFALAYIDQPHHDSEDRETTARIAMFYYLEHDLAKAFARFQEAFAAQHNPYWGLFVFLVADELRDTPARDEALAHIQAKGLTYLGRRDGKPRTTFVNLAQTFAQDLAEGGKAQFDIAELEKQFDAGEALDSITARFFLGKYLELHGRKDDAIRLWKYCMGLEAFEKGLSMSDQLRTFAGHNLLRHNVNPEDYQDILTAPKPAKKQP
jgi:tetratricopeptide (TPR) repeat protein